MQKSGAAGRPAVSHSICHRPAAPPHPIFAISTFLILLFLPAEKSRKSVQNLKVCATRKKTLMDTTAHAALHGPHRVLIRNEPFRSFCFGLLALLVDTKIMEPEIRVLT